MLIDSLRRITLVILQIQVQSMNSSKTTSQPMSPLEAAVLDLNKELRASGRTVTEETVPSDGREYQVVFPANRESEQSLSESPSNMSQDTSSAQDDSMVPAMNSLEEALQARVQPQNSEMTLEEEKADGAVRLARLMGRRPTAEELKHHREG